MSLQCQIVMIMSGIMAISAPIDRTGCGPANKSISVVSCRNFHETAYLEGFLKTSSVYFFFPILKTVIGF
jgi:hypothetical protein